MSINLLISLATIYAGIAVLNTADGNPSIGILGLAMVGLGLLFLVIHLATNRIVKAIMAANNPSNPSKPSDEPSAAQVEETPSQEH